jgi:DUF1365 family protein
MSATGVPCASLYRAQTVHVRFAPFVHRFRYSLSQLLVDVDRLEEGLAGLRLMRLDRPGLFSFHRKDHGDRSGGPLRPWAEARFAEAGVALEGGRVELLCFPRILNFVFNPISVFFGYGPDGRLKGVIYEVNNTFGETHSYVAPAVGGVIERQEAVKVFHVSPFFDVAGRYRFTLRAPAERFSLVVDKLKEAGRDFTAAWQGKRHRLSDGELARTFVLLPWMTLSVVLAIHWQALLLVLRGAKYHHKPLPPGPASTGVSAAER